MLLRATVDKQLTSGVRRRLGRARENGYLNATCESSQRIVHSHGFWCWRLRVPLIWFERKSPRSKYGRVHLDLFTTANVLTEEGQAGLDGLGERFEVRGRVVISAGTGLWEDVPVERIEELCRTVYRIATRLGNYELRRRYRSPETARMMATLENVLPWRMSA